MIPIPDDPSDPCLIGLDPGSTSLGVSVIFFDPVTLTPTRIIPRTYNGNKVGIRPWEQLVHGERYSRIAALRRKLREVFNEHQPSYIGSESPFYNRLRPNAYGVLMEVLCEIRRACVQYNLFTPLHLIDPPTVKNAVGAKGGADKDPVRAAIAKIPEIMATIDVSLDAMDEHAVDATAVGYAMLQKIKRNEALRKE